MRGYKIFILKGKQSKKRKKKYNKLATLKGRSVIFEKAIITQKDDATIPYAEASAMKFNRTVRTLDIHLKVAKTINEDAMVICMTSLTLIICQ